MNDQWFKVENLAESQAKMEDQYENGIINNKNDFHSYRIMAEHGAGSNIESHNATGSAASAIAFFIHKAVKRYARKHHISTECMRKMADFGGGCGFIAAALDKLGYNVCSYDIVKYAGVYGRMHFPHVRFITKPLQEDEILEEGLFDVIVANEFYPFTRTGEWEYQKKYIKMCLKNLKENGILVIGLNDGVKNSLLNNRNRMENEFKQCNIKLYQRPRVKIYQITHNYFAACVLSSIVDCFRTKSYLILMQNAK